MERSDFLKRRAGKLALLFLLLVSLIVPARTYAAGAPTVKEFNSYCIVQSDGTLYVKMDLIFLETESRSQIRKMGPFDSGHTLVKHSLSDGTNVIKTNFSETDTNFYQIGFDQSTTSGKTYTLHVEYTVDHDITGRSKAGIRDVGWSPFQWELNIGKIVVQMVLPVELSSNINKPEDVTQKIVDSTGVTADNKLKSNYDRFIYFVTPDDRTGKKYLSVWAQKNDAPSMFHPQVNMFVPEKYFTGENNPPSKDTGFTFTVDEISKGKYKLLFKNFDPKLLDKYTLYFQRRNLSDPNSQFESYTVTAQDNSVVEKETGLYVEDEITGNPGDKFLYQAYFADTNDKKVLAAPDVTVSLAGPMEVIQNLKVDVKYDKNGNGTVSITRTSKFTGEKPLWEDLTIIPKDSVQWVDSATFAEGDQKFIESKSQTVGTFYPQTVEAGNRYQWYWGASAGAVKTFTYTFNVKG